jgi:LEA14-like dessication related protein
MKKLWAVLALLVPLGCATPEDARPPTIDLVNLSLVSTGIITQELRLDIKIGNPNDFAIPLTGLAFKLDVNGQPFADGLSNKSVTVPRLGYATVPVTGNTSTLSLLRQMMTLGDRDRIDYRLHGTAYVRGLGHSDAVPFERKGSLSLRPATGGGGNSRPGIRMFAPVSP